MLGVLGPKDVIYPDDCPVAQENIRKRLSGESQSIQYETRIVTKNGDIRSVELYGSRTLFQGRPGVVGTALDTTERKMAYEALKKSEERLNMTIDAVNDGIWEWNLKTNNAVFSPRYFTMLGYEPMNSPRIMSPGSLSSIPMTSTALNRISRGVRTVAEALLLRSECEQNLVIGAGS